MPLRWGGHPSRVEALKGDRRGHPLTLIGFDDDGGEGLNSSLTRPLSAGTYLIAVSALFGSGPFTLQVSETTVLIAAIGEVVGSIVPGQTATGILSSGGVDFYALTVVFLQQSGRYPELVVAGVN